MSKKASVGYDELMKLAKDCSVENNPLFISAARSAAEEMIMIEKMNKQLDEDGYIISKEYVKGRQNLVAHPFVAEIPKHRDCLNKTLKQMMDIIETMGAKKEPEDELDIFLNRA